MAPKLSVIARAVRRTFSRLLRRHPRAPESTPAPFGAEATLVRFSHLGPVVVGGALLGGGGWFLSAHPPLRPVQAGEVGLRTNHVTGTVTQWRDGVVLVIPGLHDL